MVGLLPRRAPKVLFWVGISLFVLATGLALWSFGAYWRLQHFIEAHDIYLFEEISEPGESGTAAPTQQKFLPVNRSPEHLLEQALELARARGIEERVHGLYRPEIEVARRERLKKIHEERRQRLLERRRELAKKRRSRWVTLQDAQPISQRWEPIFSLPLDRSQFWLSSPFGPRRIGGRAGFHRGIDMAANWGTPVRAAGDGVVVLAQQERGYGKTVVIEHPHGWRTRYAHLSAILTRPDCEIKEGDIIGRVGATGYVRKRSGGSGAHLHFEITDKRGARVNPFYLLKE